MADSLSSMDRYPPVEAVSRAVLVRNISPLATSATLEDFFSFCGTIESHRIRKVSTPSVSSTSNLNTSSGSGTQQAIVVFSDERARDNALVMDQSSIVDTLVEIKRVPDGFDFNKDPAPPPSGFFGSGFAAFGDLFAGVGSAVATEVEKASKAIDSATDTGVLKSAKDQMALARKRTTDFAADIDHKYHVRENIYNAAEAGKSHATAVASVLATQTSNIATQVDKSLHISENTEKISEKARENPTVNSGIRAVTGGFQNLLAQTGLQSNTNSSSGQPTSNQPTRPAGGDPPTSSNHNTQSSVQ